MNGGRLIGKGGSILVLIGAAQLEESFLCHRKALCRLQATLCCHLTAAVQAQIKDQRLQFDCLQVKLQLEAFIPSLGQNLAHVTHVPYTVAGGVSALRLSTAISETVDPHEQCARADADE